ncbi:hypothetical protein I4U23_015961 [Adineta vaga]|nr:hypothetical protein I4U23_015961 [Adineta vaga]
MSSASVINNIAIEFNRYTPIPVFILGVTGNILNMIIFTRPSFIRNPCSIYFFYSSIANLNVLFFGLIVRNLADGFQIDLLAYNLPFCRFRYFLMHSSMVLSLFLIIFAGIDRFCISSRNARYRHLSNIKYARYCTSITTLICLLMYSHALFLFTIEQSKTKPTCYARTGIYRIFYDFLYATTYSFLPPLIMIIVGLATIHNIQQIHVHVNIDRFRRKDRQLVKMLLVQFILTIIFTLPAALQKLYVTFMENAEKTSYDLAVESLTAQLMRVFGYINSSTSFYVFIFSGDGFRNEFGQIIGKVIGFIFGQNGQLYRRFQRFIRIPLIVQAAP